MSLPLRIALAASIFLAASASAQPTPADRTQILKLVDANAAQYKQVSKEIWGFAELGYHENKSSTLLQDQLKKAGFSLQDGVADEPTAFIASYGSGKPVIAIERHAQGSARFQHGRAQRFHMQRAAVEVDIAPVVLRADGFDLRAQAAE